MSSHIKRYVILTDFFRVEEDYDFLMRAMNRNRVDFVGPCTDTIDNEFLMFSGTRVAMLGLVKDLVKADIMSDDLIEDFDRAFDASESFVLTQK